VIIVAFALLLGFIVCSAAIRYRDVRFGFVAAAVATLGVVGAAGAIALVQPGSIPGAELGTLSASLLIALETLFYLSFVVSRSWAPRPPTS